MPKRCRICHEEVVQGPRPVDWTHAHGDVYCGTGDGAMATPDHSLGGVAGIIPLPGDQPNEPIIPIGQSEDETPEPPMTAKFTVSVNRSYTTQVEVEAESAEAAFRQVNRRDFPLPPLEEWSGNKDWRITVYDEHGDSVFEDEG